jgi:uncharacterized protein YcaQ
VPRPHATAPPLVPAATARRLFLGARGLLDDPTRRATPARVCAIVARLGYVQIDSIQVVERAHHLILAARLVGYRPAMLHRLLERDRRLFEHWTHDAAAIPTALLRYWRHRYDRSHQAIFGSAWWRARLGRDHATVAAAVLARIRSDGPLQSKDFDHDRNGTTVGWWGWTPQKAALEYLWHTSVLAVSRRVQFQKVYDLAERVLPAVASAPTAEELCDWTCSTALARLEIATPVLTASHRWLARVLRGDGHAVVEERRCPRGGYNPRGCAVASIPRASVAASPGVERQGDAAHRRAARPPGGDAAQLLDDLERAGCVPARRAGAAQRQMTARGRQRPTKSDVAR